MALIHPNEPKRAKTKIRELRALYLLHVDMCHCDRDVFHITVEAHIEAQPTWAFQNWLNIQVSMSKHSIKEAA
jgi:hypothetical protein